MLVYFVKATYTDGIYKISDFYTGNSYKTPTDKSLDILLEASDGIVTTKPTTGILPDNTTIRDYTHMLVPSQKKIYKIIGYEYVNVSQTRMTLQEDPLLSNYKELETKNIMLSRTNDESKFIGMNDIDNISLRPDYDIRGKMHSGTGQYVLYFLDASSVNNYPEEHILISSPLWDNKVFNANIHPFDTLTNIAAIKAKYPEVVTNDPFQYDYFNKLVKLTNGSTYVAIYYDGQIKWKRNQTILFTDDSGNVIDGDGSIYIRKDHVLVYDPVNIAPDISCYVLAFPLEGNIAFDISPYVSLNYTDQIQIQTDIVLRGVKIVNELMLIKDNSSIDYNESFDTWEDSFLYQATKTIQNINNINTLSTLTKDSEDNMVLFYSGTLNKRTRIRVLQINEFNTLVNLDFPDLGSTIYDYEPFKEYEISVFGERFKVARKYLDNIKLIIAPSMSNIGFIGYYGNNRNHILFSGSFTNDVRWSTDQLDLFNQQNPTYKDQFNNKLWQKGIQSIGMGAAGGALKGGLPGAAAGAGLGIVNTAISTGFALENERLRRKGLELAPDQIFGIGSNINVVAQTIYGIQLIIKTSDFQTEMLNDYYMRGFMTSRIAKINVLPYETNPIFGSATIVAGQLLEVVKNQNATDEINRILQQGIILIP